MYSIAGNNKKLNSLQINVLLYSNFSETSRIFVCIKCFVNLFDMSKKTIEF